MGIEPPFLYDPVPREGSQRPYSQFDPKAVSRASFSPPRSQRPKPDGPLVSFNIHPDSYLVLPYGNTNATPMNPSVKKWVKWLRIIQLVLRFLELLAGCGLLVMMIMIQKVNVTTGWIMRIVPGVAILHTIYALYHLSRKASGRTPASTASYMLFASFFDVSIAPFYAFSALVAKTRSSDWATLLSDQGLTPTLKTIVFYLATVGGGLHLISLAISIYLAVIFRNITMLPPDMNPLEDHLTARPHKRNKSSVSTYADSEERIYLEDKRRSDSEYRDLGRPPTIPFLQTRSGSTDSFGTYQSSASGSNTDLPARQYHVPSGTTSRPTTAEPKANMSPRSTPPSYREPPRSDTGSPRTALPAPNFSLPSSSKRNSYTEFETVPPSVESPLHKMPTKEAWYTTDIPRRSPSPKKNYQPLQQDRPADETSRTHPGGLSENPPFSYPRNMAYQTKRESPLQEISNNRTPSSSDIASVSNYSQDGIDDLDRQNSDRSIRSDKKYYGELRPTSNVQTPVLVGRNDQRQTSSSIDISNHGYSKKGGYRRDVSGKIAEEGRAEASGLPRLRKVSGMLK